MILVLSVAQVLLQLPAEIFKLSYFILVGLTLRGLQLRGQHLSSRGGIVSFQGVDHRFVHGCLGDQPFLGLRKLTLHLIILLLKEGFLLFEFRLL